MRVLSSNSLGTMRAGCLVMRKLALFAVLASSLMACGGAVGGGYDPGNPKDSGPPVDSTPSNPPPSGCTGIAPDCADGCGGMQPETCVDGEWECLVTTGCVSPFADAGEPGDASSTDGGGCEGPVPDCGTHCGGVETAYCDDGTWICPPGDHCATSDAGECEGPIPSCDDGCGEYQTAYCDDGAWVCPPGGGCEPIDAGICPGTAPECVSWCGDVNPSYCDGDGNWACPPDLCDTIPDGGPNPTDAAVEVDAGCVAIPGAPPCNPGIVECGGTQCPVPANECCEGGGLGGSSVCVTENATCAATADGGGVSTVTCDETADCAADQICCLYVLSISPPVSQTACQAVTTSEAGCSPTKGLVRAQICKTDAECASGACHVYDCLGTQIIACENPLASLCTVVEEDAG
jgi:hypothetical protein